MYEYVYIRVYASMVSTNVYILLTVERICSLYNRTRAYLYSCAYKAHTGFHNIIEIVYTHTSQQNCKRASEISFRASPAE